MKTRSPLLLALFAVISCRPCNPPPPPPYTPTLICYIMTSSGGPPIRCLGHMRADVTGMMECRTPDMRTFRMRQEHFLSESCRLE